MCRRKFCDNIAVIYLLQQENIAHINNLYPESFIPKAFDPIKKKKIPKVSKKQVTILKLRINRLYCLISFKKPEPLFILDVESCFTFTGSNMPQNDHYYSTVRRFTENCIKYRCMVKFQSKLMCWIAISARGILKPHFCLSYEAVNTEIYQRKYSTTPYSIL